MDEHMRLHRELEALRVEGGLVKGDKPFDSAFNHRNEPLGVSPGLGDDSPDAELEDEEGGSRPGTPSQVKFRSPR